MKVALVAEWLDTARGGAEASIRQFIDLLLEQGVSIEVFTRSILPAEPNLTFHTIQPRAATRAGKTASFIATVERRLPEAGCDIVHAFTPCLGADIYQPRGGTLPETIRRTIAAAPPGVPRTIKRWTIAFNQRQRMVLAKERACLTGPRRPIVIAISAYVARQLRDHYNYPDSDIRQIMNGVNVEPAKPERRANDRHEIRAACGVGDHELLLLQICHNFKLKGVRHLIEAVALMNDGAGPPVRAVVVGRDNPAPMRALARTLGIGEKIRFTGPVDGVAAYYHAADVLVHPTYYDPCSRVVLESVARGLPAITTRFDGASEVLTDQSRGFVLDSPERITELAHCARAIGDTGKQPSKTERTVGDPEAVSMARHAAEVCRLYRSLPASGGSAKNR